MNNEIRERYLKLALVVAEIAFLLIYPLGLVWPSGWVWHGGEGSYYLQMISGVYAVLGIFLIAAAKNHYIKPQPNFLYDLGRASYMRQSWRFRHFMTAANMAT